MTCRNCCRMGCVIILKLKLILIAIAIIVYGSVAVVGPHSHEKSYETTECNTTSVTWGYENLKCNCHTDPQDDDTEICTEGDFPCLNIQAVYKDEDGVKHSTQLYQFYSGMASDPQCSYPACNAYDRFNETSIPGAMVITGVIITKNQGVIDFASQHHEGALYTCYYKSSDFGRVIAGKEFTTMDAFNVIFWPLLVIIIMIIVLIVVILRMCRKPQDQRSDVEFNRL